MENQPVTIVLSRKELTILRQALQHIYYLTRHQAGINEFFYNEYNIPKKPELITRKDIDSLENKLEEMR